MTTIEQLRQTLERLRVQFADNADNATEAVANMGCIAYMCDDPLQWDNEVSEALALLDRLEEEQDPARFTVTKGPSMTDYQDLVAEYKRLMLEDMLPVTAVSDNPMDGNRQMSFDEWLAFTHRIQGTSQ